MAKGGQIRLTSGHLTMAACELALGKKKGGLTPTCEPAINMPFGNKPLRTTTTISILVNNHHSLYGN